MATVVRRTCSICGCDYDLSLSRANANEVTFCSRQCGYKGRRDDRVKADRGCVICGTLFCTPPSSGKKYCSRDCRKQSTRYKTHGQSNTRLHNIWCGMKSRCRRDRFAKYYRDRGIVVCEEWSDSYETFRDWALKNGYLDGLEIDRVDNDGNYEPNNCRWVTRQQQMTNTNKQKRRGATSKYKGVQYMSHKTSKPWRASIRKNGKPKHLGVFLTEIEAAKAYDAAAIQQYGKFSNVNFK